MTSRMRSQWALLWKVQKRMAFCTAFTDREPSHSPSTVRWICREEIGEWYQKLANWYVCQTLITLKKKVL